MKDPRRIQRGNFKYPLEEILFVAISSSICGISDWDEMEMFGKDQINWFGKYFDFKYGIPSHDTISRLFNLLDPNEFCKYFVEWVDSLRTFVNKEVISVDGKTVKSSAEKSKGIKALHFVSAYAAENQLVLCQEAVNEKSNEITAVPKLLDMIVCKGAIITVDALNTQTEIAKKVIEKEADYIFALKGNHKFMHQSVIEAFEKQTVDSINIKDDLGHGRVEKRICSVISNLQFVDGAQNWDSIQTIIKIESERYHKANGKNETETRYYISSLQPDAELINKSIRQHWSIENKLHWMLDVSFKEDASRKRKGYSTQNYSMICKVALNLIKQGNGKGSYKKQKFKALLNHTERELLMGLF